MRGIKFGNLLFVFLLSLSTSLFAETRKIQVEGTGSCSIMPDGVRLFLSIVATDTSTIVCREKILHHMNEIGPAFKVFDSSLVELFFGVLTEGSNCVCRNDTPVTQYGATKKVNIVISDLTALDSVISLIARFPLRFDSDPDWWSSKADSLEAYAVNKACEDATHQANLYAGKMGARLGKVLSIQPKEHHGYRGVDMIECSSKMFSNANAITPREVIVRRRVLAEYQLR